MSSQGANDTTSDSGNPDGDTQIQHPSDPTNACSELDVGKVEPGNQGDACLLSHAGAPEEVWRYAALKHVGSKDREARERVDRSSMTIAICGLSGSRPLGLESHESRALGRRGDKRTWQRRRLYPGFKRTPRAGMEEF